MKKQPVLFFLLLVLILICSSCNLFPAESSQDINPLGQVNQTEQPDQTEVKLEKNDWSNIWIENANQSEKPRILFVGDSITEGYYPFITGISITGFFPGLLC